MRETAVVERGAKVETCGGAEAVSVRTPDEERVEMTAELGCAGVVVLSDNWFPGWRATLDGQAVEILRADGALRAVAVPRGRHRIAMEYRPESVYWGAVVSVCVFLGLAAIAVYSKRAA